jgi:hypothetical protein
MGPTEWVPPEGKEIIQYTKLRDFNKRQDEG